MGMARKFMRSLDKAPVNISDDSVALACRIVRTVAAVGFAMTPFAANAAPGIVKVNGQEYLGNGQNVAHIYADAVLNQGVGLNTFNKFNVDAGKIANMYFRKENGNQWVNNLVNIVNDRINVNGTVNAIQNSKIGGNLIFLSKDGFAVGKSGVINAGSLSVMITNSEYFVKAGMANWADGATEDIANGAIDFINIFGANVDKVDIDAFQETFLVNNWGEIKSMNVPINKTGTISIAGKINATEGIAMKAAHIDIGKDANTGELAAAVLQTGITDFSSLVNIEGNEAVKAGLGENLTAVQTASGDIVLEAFANTVNTKDSSFAPLGTEVLGSNPEGYNVVKADINVHQGSSIIAAGDIDITAEASNGSGQAGLFGADIESINLADLVGSMAKTVAVVNIDGAVTANTIELPAVDDDGNPTTEILGGNVNIHAGAENAYVAGALSDPTAFATGMIKEMIPLDSDLNIVFLESEATVNIGEKAVITAKSDRKDDIEEVPGWEIGDFELTEKEENRNYALNISASTEMEVGAGSSAAAVKLQKRRAAGTTGGSSGSGNDPGQFVPNAGVTYLEVKNEANVNVAGKINSKGDTNISAEAALEAEAAAAADAPTVTSNQEVNNFVNAAVVVADIENKANVVVTGNESKVSDGLMNIAAVAEGEFSTEATVNAGEVSIANTAVNITDIVTDASVKIDTEVKGAEVEIVAENSIENGFIANNAVGLSKMGAKMASRRATASRSFGRVLGSAAGRIRAPQGFEKLGEFITVGASIGVLNETNTATVTLSNNAKVTADDIINISANTSIGDTHVNVSGATNNYHPNVNQSVLVNASVLYSDIKSDATVVIEGSENNKKAELNAPNVNIHANSEFVYDRIGAMWDEIKVLLGYVKEAYEHDAEIVAMVDELFKTTQAEEYLTDPTTAGAIEFFGDLEALVGMMNMSTVATNMEGVESLVALPTALMEFINGANYANFYVSSSTGSKKPGTSGSGTGGSGTSGQAAKLGVAGSVNINNLENNAQVIIGKGAVINADETVGVYATALQEDVTFNGKVKLFIPKLATSGGSDIAVGGNVGYHTGKANSAVVVAEDVVVSGNSIDIAAQNDVMHIAATFGGGEAGNTGISGMAAYMSGESDSVVVVDDDAKLTAVVNSFTEQSFYDEELTKLLEKTEESLTDKEKKQKARLLIEAKQAYDEAVVKNGAVNITASNETNIQNIILDKTSGSNTAIGAAVGIVEYDINNIAAIANNAGDVSNELSGLVYGKLAAKDEYNDEDVRIYSLNSHLGEDDADEAITGEVNANKLTIDAKTTGIIDTITVAGVTAGSSGASSGAGSSLGIPAKIGVAGSVSYNDITGTTGAYLQNTAVNMVVAKTEQPVVGNDNATVNVTAEDDVMIGAYSGAAALKKSGASSGGSSASATLAGAVAMNESTKNVVAQIKKAQIKNAKAITNTAFKSGAVIAAGLALGKESAGGTGSGLAGLGASASVNEIHNKVYAIIEDTNINQVAGNEADVNVSTVLQNIAKDNDIQVAGGINAQYAKAYAALGAAVSEMTAVNDIQAKISGGNMRSIGALTNYAQSYIVQVGAALSAGVISGQSYLGVEGAVVLNDLSNNISATIENSAINAVSVDVKAYDGGLAENKYHDQLVEDGFDIDGTEAMDDINAGGGDVSVVENNLGAVDAGSEDKEVYTGNQFVAEENDGNLIITSAAGLALNTSDASASVTAGAAVSTNKINNSFNAGIKGGTITTANDTNVKAESDTLMIGVAAGAAVGTAAQGAVAIGSSSTLNLTNNTIAEVEDAAVNATDVNVDTKTKSRLINVAGQVSVGKGNVAAGASVAINDLNNVTGSYVRGAKLNSDSVNVRADNESKNYAIGAGVVVSTNQQSGAANANVAINRGANSTEAIVDKYEENNNGVTLSKRGSINNARNINVAATDETVLKTIAGGVTIGSGYVSIGGTVAYNEISGQKNIARLSNNDITTLENSTIAVNANDVSDLLTIAAGGGVSTGQQSGVAQGSVAIAKIDKATEASMNSADINADSKAQNAVVNVAADSNTKLITSADVLSVGMGYVSAGAGVAVTQSNADTKAVVDGGRHNVKSELVEAASDNEIFTIGIGVSVTGGQGGSLAGNVAVNNITNDTEAVIRNNANINASGSVGVLANSNEHLENYAGTLSATIGKGYVAVGMSVAVNSISGNTSALVDDSNIITQGNDEGVGRSSKENGLVVHADAKHELDNIIITAGAAISAQGGGALSGTVAVNTLEGASSAAIKESNINNVETVADTADVSVLANDYTDISSHVGTAAIGIGAQAGVAIGEAADSNKLSRDVKAQIIGASDKNTVNADKLDVKALNGHKVLTTATGLSVAAGMYGSASIAGTVSTLNVDNNTFAGVENIKGVNNGMQVLAHQDNNVELYGNAASLGGSIGGGGIGAGILVVKDSSVTNAVLQNADITHKDADSDDSVIATSDTDVKTELSNAVLQISIGGGIGGVVSVNNINNVVQTDVIGANVSGGDEFTAKAENNITTDYAAGVGSGSLVAVATGVNVNNINTATVTNIVGSEISANTINVTADENRSIKQIAVGAALGGIAVPVNVLVTNIGTAVGMDYGTVAAEKQNVDGTNSDAVERVGENVSIKDSIDKSDEVISTQNDGLKNNTTVADVIGGTGSDLINLNGIAGGETVNADSGLKLENIESGVTQSIYTLSEDQVKGIRANVIGSRLKADADVNINADATTNAEIGMVDASIAIGSIGSTVGVLNVTKDSAVNINDAYIDANNINVNTNQDGLAELNAYQGRISGVDVNVTVTSASLHGKNDINLSVADLRALNVLKVNSYDTSKLKLETIAATLSVGNVGVLVADASNDSTSTITIANGSHLESVNGNVSVLAHHGVSDDLMDAARQKYEDSINTNAKLQAAENAYKIAEKAYNAASAENKLNEATILEFARLALEDAKAEAKRTAETDKINYLMDNQNAETINVKVIPTSVGVLATGLAVSSTLDDNSSTAVVIGKNEGKGTDNNTFIAGNNVTINARNNSVNESSSIATSASVGVAVGVTGVDIDADAKSSVTIGDDNTFIAGNGLKNVDIEALANVVNKADMISVGGAGVASFAVNWADVTAKTDVDVIVGSNIYKAGILNINGESIVDQYAQVTGVVAGIATSGTNFAKINAYDNVEVNVNGMQTVDSVVDTANITAHGIVSQVASSNGYGGALLDISPCASMIKASIGSEEENAVTKVVIGGIWNVDEFNAAASHENYVDLDNDAVKASVVGLSGVYGYNDIWNDTQIVFKNATISARGDVNIKAVNDINYRNRVWGGGYGVIEAAGVFANDDIGLAAKVSFDNTDVYTLKGIDVYALTGAAYDEATGKPGAQIDKEVIIKSAGVAAGTLAVSDDEISLTNDITVGTGSSLNTIGISNKTADINLVAADRINIIDETTADTQGGIVGASSTSVDAAIVHNNKITIEGTLNSNYDVNLDAGDSSVTNITLKSNAYNKTAAPLVTIPLLDDSVKQANKVIVADSGKIETSRNINIAADKGNTTVVTQSQSWKWVDGGLTGTSSIASTADGTGDSVGTFDNNVVIDGTLVAGKNNVLDITIADGRGVPVDANNSSADTDNNGYVSVIEALTAYGKDTLNLSALEADIRNKQEAYDALLATNKRENSTETRYEELAAMQAEYDNKYAVHKQYTAEKAPLDSELSTANTNLESAKKAETASLTVLNTAKTASGEKWDNLSAIEKGEISRDEYIADNTISEQKAYNDAVKAREAAASVQADAQAAVDNKQAQIDSYSYEALGTAIAVLKDEITAFENSEEVVEARTALASAKTTYNHAITEGINTETINSYVFQNKENNYTDITVSDWYGKQYGTPAETVGLKDYALHLISNLKRLTKMMQEYNGTGAGDAYAEQLSRVQSELVALGLGYATKVNNENVFMIAEDASTVPTVTLKNITVSGGDVNINSGTLHGTGKVTANGNPVINVTNDSSFYLDVRNITIDGAGGNVKYNDVVLNKNLDTLEINSTPGDLNGNAAINIKGSTAVKAMDSEIFTPDIGVFGTIYNPYGKVNINNVSNSIYVAGSSGNYTGNSDSGTGSIKAREVTLTAGGSITQGYQDGIVNIGGNPHYAVGDEYVAAIQTALIDKLSNKTAEGKYYTAFGSVEKLAEFIQRYVKVNNTPVSEADALTVAKKLTGQNGNAQNGIFASGAIFINAANINVNGTIQSGFDTYQLNIDNGKLDNLAKAAYTGTGSDDSNFMNANYLVTDGMAGAVYSNGKYIYNIKAWYNPVTKQVFTEDIDQSSGGRVYLTGAIANTNASGGKIIALDGGSNIQINGILENANYSLKIGSINANRVDGVISITDTNKTGADRTTVYTSADGRTNEYNPVSGQVYNWTNGEASRVITTYKHVSDSSWWGLDKDSWENVIGQMDQVEKQGLATDTATEAGVQSSRDDVINNNVVAQEVTYIDFDYTSGESNIDVSQDSRNDNLYTITFERSGEPKQGKDNAGNLLYLDTNGNLTTNNTGVPYYLKDANGNYIYETKISDRATTTKKKGLFGLWGKTVTTTWKETKGMLTAYNFGLKADNDIGIAFIGNDTSVVDIKGSAKEILLNGDLRADEVSIINTVGSIKTTNFNSENTNKATIYSDNIIVNAGTDIEVEQRSVNDYLTLIANSTNGDINFKGLAGILTGDVYLKSISAANGIANIDVEGSVLSTAPQSTYRLLKSNNNSAAAPNIQALGIVINAAGCVGDANKRLLVASSADMPFDMQSDGDIYLQHTGTGAMYLGEIVSTNGNVDIISDGGFVDGILENTVTSATDVERLAEWQRLGLLSGESIDERMQNNLASQNANLQAQAQSIIGESGSSMLTTYGSQLVSDVADEYQAFFDAQVEMIAKQTALNNAVSTLGKEGTVVNQKAYNAALTDYNVAYAKYSQAENVYQQAKDNWISGYITAQGVDNKVAGLLDAYETLNHQAVGETGDKYGWSQRQLLYAVQDSVINPAAGSISDVKTSNITANNILLTTKDGSFGEVVDTQKTVIEITDMFDETNTKVIDDLQKLSQARADDVTWGNEYITVERTVPISITLNDNASGTVTLVAPNATHVYMLAKDSAMNLGQVVTSGDVRLLAHEGIQGVGESGPTIIGSNITLEGGRGDIGNAFNNVNVGLLNGGKVNANAVGNIYMTQYSGASGIVPSGSELNTDFVLGSLAAKNIYITATGNVISGQDKIDSDANGTEIVEFSNVSYINAGEALNVTTSGGVGTASEGLRIKNSGAQVNIAADGAMYLEAKQDGTLILGNISGLQDKPFDEILVISSEGNVQLGVSDDASTSNIKETAFVNADGGTVNVTATKDIIFGGRVEANGIMAHSYVGDIEQSTVSEDDMLKVDAMSVSAVQGSVVLSNEHNQIGEFELITLGENLAVNVNQDSFTVDLGEIANNAGGNLSVENNKENGAINVKTDGSGVNVYGDITVIADGNVTIQESALLQTNKDDGVNDSLLVEHGNVSIISHGGDVTVEGRIEAAATENGSANVVLAAITGNVTVDNGAEIDAQTDIVVNANNAALLEAQMTAGNDVKVNTKDVSINENVTVGNDVIVQAEKAAAVNGIVAAGNDVKVNAEDVSINEDITVGNDVIVQAEKAAAVNGIVTAGNEVRLEVVDDANVNGTIDAKEIVVVVDKGSVNIGSNGRLLADEAVTIKNINGDIIGEAASLVQAGTEESLNGTVSVVAENGEIDLYEVLAGNEASIVANKGNVSLHQINGQIVALATNAEEAALKVNNAIVGESLQINSNNSAVRNVEQRTGAAGTLNVELENSDQSKPMSNIELAFGRMSNGVELNQLWTDKATISVESGELHLPKLAVLGNATITASGYETTIYGVPPTRKDSNSIYWYDVAKNNPAANGSNIDWMYLHFDADGVTQHSNGVLLYLDNYYYAYDQRFTALDHLNERLARNANEVYAKTFTPYVNFYRRYYLYDLPQYVYKEAGEEDIVVETM